MRTVAMLAAAMLLPAMAAIRLPAPLATDAPGLVPYSEAVFRKWGLRVYDAVLWTEGARPWSGAAPHALEIRYAIAVRGADLARRTVDEMRAQGRGDARALDRWEGRMREVFPDVARGERLVGYAVPGRETRFYAGERLAGVIADADFTEAFFAIWLGERTSEPQLRRALLKLP